MQSGRSSSSTTGQRPSFSRRQQLQSYDPNTANQHTTSQGPAPMDIDAAYNSSWHKGKGKGKKGHQKGSAKAKDARAPTKTKGKEKRISHRSRESMSTRKSVQGRIKRKRKVSPEQHERERKIKMKGYMLEMWATRPHRKALTSCSVQRWQR